MDRRSAQHNNLYFYFNSEQPAIRHELANGHYVYVLRYSIKMDNKVGIGIGLGWMGGAK